MEIQIYLGKIIPPVYFFSTLFLMICLDRYFPIVTIIPGSFHYYGIAIIVLGFSLSSWGAYSFKKADTPLKPFEASTTLVNNGPFRYTRNPMYLGMMIFLFGTWIVLGTLAPLFMILVFFLIIQEVFIKYEEPFMQSLFGAQYEEYKNNVRRWL